MPSEKKRQRGAVVAQRTPRKGNDACGSSRAASDRSVVALSEEATQPAVQLRLAPSPLHLHVLCHKHVHRRREVATDTHQRPGMAYTDLLPTFSANLQATTDVGSASFFVNQRFADALDGCAS